MVNQIFYKCCTLTKKKCLKKCQPTCYHKLSTDQINTLRSKYATHSQPYYFSILKKNKKIMHPSYKFVKNTQTHMSLAKLRSEKNSEPTVDSPPTQQCQPTARALRRYSWNVNKGNDVINQSLLDLVPNNIHSSPTTTKINQTDRYDLYHQQ